MILSRPLAKYRAWWDTSFSRKWEVTGLLARMWAYHFLPTPHPIEANDKDHLRW
jgi:hypothetical protein